MAAPIDRTDSTLVIGLGRFGAAVAATLDRLGREVLAVETNSAIVRQWTGRIPLIEADATDMEALEQLGATEFGMAVVGVATSIEASVLIAGNLVDLQTPQIWAKAISRAHGRILRRIGTHHEDAVHGVVLEQMRQSRIVAAGVDPDQTETEATRSRRRRVWATSSRSPAAARASRIAWSCSGPTASCRGRSRANGSSTSPAPRRPRCRGSIPEKGRSPSGPIRT